MKTVTTIKNAAQEEAGECFDRGSSINREFKKSMSRMQLQRNNQLAEVKKAFLKSLLDRCMNEIREATPIINFDYSRLRVNRLMTNLFSAYRTAHLANVVHIWQADNPDEIPRAEFLSFFNILCVEPRSLSSIFSDEVNAQQGNLMDSMNPCRSRLMV